ncbi:hypothetical protein [Ponticaulis sp.]|uniref:hypothetical protein n=1 Tax=Ponticaulis sp. TaxID=2020902 RepID=UPI000B691F84|nr:hypothetical protein [Ponticaulis sp.]MAJ07534.1 hypothetical protein [Ponticaulis sp.]RPG17765.1 MAG: hypothetical protein CBC85_004260 [Hyphomonadaceae bacterium TMED125]|tara:strand:- start:22588 stop:23409 length:822 start_codon:yes stop_codon:yes gene_type:complete
MNLRTLRDLVRSVIEVEAEYKIRRLSYNLIPVKIRAETAVAHACVWKTGSQWIRLVLSDPRLYHFCGRKPYVWAKLKQNESFDRNVCLTASYATTDQVFQVVPKEKTRAFFVIRHPAHLFASWYVSTLVTHRLNPGILEMRAHCEDLPEEGRVEYLLGRYEKEFLGTMRAWLEEAHRSENTIIVRFEDLVGAEGLQVWRQIFDHIEIPVPEKDMAEIIYTYRIENLKKKGRQGEEDKYSKSGRTDLSVFESQVSRGMIVSATSDLVQEFGYTL